MTTPTKAAGLVDQIKAVDEKIAAATQAANSPTVSATTTVQPEAKNWWSTTDAMTISSTVLVFGLVVFFLATYLIKIGKEVEAILRVFGTIMIVFLAVFLVVAGYSDTQIAPVMGLLGTIAGYLLGRHVDAAKAASTPGKSDAAASKEV
jgi:hypothetical protein